MKFLNLKTMENITYQQPNAKPSRNEQLYTRYLETYQEEKDRQGAAYLAGKDFGISASRAYAIVRAIEKKLANSKKAK